MGHPFMAQPTVWVQKEPGHLMEDFLVLTPKKVHTIKPIGE